MNSEPTLTEDDLHYAFVKWMPLALPQVIFWHTRNENSKNAIQGKMMKRKGVKAGVHDFCLMWKYRMFATIELKSPALLKAVYSDNQGLFAEKMDVIGFPHFCCNTGEQIVEALQALGLKPLRSFPALKPKKRKTKKRYDPFSLVGKDWQC